MTTKHVTVTEQHIKSASEIHPVDYLIGKGVSLIQKGTYYTHSVHDSLVINADGKWFWNRENTGGYGAISLSRKLYELPYFQAVTDVLNATNGMEKTDFSKNVKGEYVYPEKYEVADTKATFDYLVNIRKLDRDIVKGLLGKGLIVQDKLSNIVFKWIEDGTIVGAELQGTKMMANGGYYKHIHANAKEDGGFSFDVGIPSKIAFFESSIDALSYLQLKQPENIRLVSMAGLKPETVMANLKRFLKDCITNKVKIEAVIIGVDNDTAGKNFTVQWENYIGEEILQIHVPTDKDWNEDLKRMVIRNK